MTHFVLHGINIKKVSFKGCDKKISDYKYAA